MDFSRALNPTSQIYTGNETSPDVIARRQVGTEQAGVPPLSYRAAPGVVESTHNIAHPDGGYSFGTGTRDLEPLIAWRTW